MEEIQKPSDQTLRNYTFRYKHPNNRCINRGKLEIKTVQAISERLGRVVAENERVICGTCYQYYKLQR